VGHAPFRWEELVIGVERTPGACGRVRAGHVVEGEQLSRLTMAIPDALVDLNILPIQGIPAQP
jgi:hypothetical protein